MTIIRLLPSSRRSSLETGSLCSIAVEDMLFGIMR